MQIKRSILYLLLCSICAGMFLVACKKDDAEEKVRLFRPTVKGDLVSEGNWIEVGWQAIKGAESYTLQISKDTFRTVLQTVKIDTNGHLFEGLDFETNYQLQVKANAKDTIYNSKWSTLGAIKTPKLPSILGTPLAADLTDKTVKVKWTNSGAAVTSLKVSKASDNSLVKEVPLDGTDIANQFKIVTGLTAKTKYNISIYSGTTLRGTESYTTNEPSLYTVTLKPGDDLVTAVTNAANGDVIGLDPGVYNCLDASAKYAGLVLNQKTITIVSTSGNPNNTKVNFREITLKGTGAGVSLKGIEFDGASANATTEQALYFINLVGLTTDAEAATFTNVNVENCVIRNMGNCLVRANRGTAINSHKIGTMRFSECVIGDCMALNAYTFFTLDKLEFTKLEIVKSTLKNLGRAFFSWSTAMTTPSTPVLSIDQCTINNFGRDGRGNAFLDANANAITATIKNSIIANAPYPSHTITSLFRATAAIGSTMGNTNIYNLVKEIKETPEELTFPVILAQSNNKKVALTWTAATTDFTLPAGSELRTSSASGGPIGDPRWAQ